MQKNDYLCTVKKRVSGLKNALKRKIDEKVRR